MFRSSVQGNGQRLEPAHELPETPLDLLRWHGQRRLREPLEKRPQGRRGLDLPELRAEASVHAVSEFQMSLGTTVDVEDVGLVEERGISVRRPPAR